MLKHRGVTPLREALEARLRTAEQSLDDATERRVAAEQVLWRSMRPSTAGDVSGEQIAEARAQYLEAEQQRSGAQQAIDRLKAELSRVREREAHLLTITDAALRHREGGRTEAARRSPGLRSWLSVRLWRDRGDAG